MTVILAIDTSTPATSVALVESGRVLGQASSVDARAHAEELAPMLQGVLRSTNGVTAEVAAIAVGVGPGPYTGLRVGIATARALAMAWDVPVYGLCSLDAIGAARCAAGLASDGGVATDARRNEVYWAWYSAAGVRLDGPLVSKVADIPGRYRSGSWAGAGALRYSELLGAVDGALDLMYPSAGWVGLVVAAALTDGPAVSVERAPESDQDGDGSLTASALRDATLLPARPLYLRRPDAVPSASR